MPEAVSEGYLAFENGSDDSGATFKPDSPQGEMLGASRLSANAGRQQAFGLLSIEAQCPPIATHHGRIMSNLHASIGAGDFKSTCLKLLDEVTMVCGYGRGLCLD